MNKRVLDPTARFTRFCPFVFILTLESFKACIQNSIYLYSNDAAHANFNQRFQDYLRSAWTYGASKMDQRQHALILCLKEVGVAPKIESMEDRIKIQKAIYLIQEAGVQLGYHYSWYIRGPYCTSLADDYYKISEDVNGNDGSESDRKLAGWASDALDAKKGVFDAHQEAGLEPAYWLELIASLHFLLHRSGYDEERAAEEIDKRKPHLAGKAKYGLQALKEYDLLK